MTSNTECAVHIVSHVTGEYIATIHDTDVEFYPLNRNINLAGTLYRVMELCPVAPMHSNSNTLIIVVDKVEEEPTKFSDLVNKELDTARNNHADMHSMHEGYAVLLEEIDELWEAIKDNKIHHTTLYNRRVLSELVQVGAMARRFYEDLIDE